MIKKGFFSFLKCLKYYFVPLGILSIFTVIGLYFCVIGINNAITDFFKKVAEIANAVIIDWDGIWGAFMGEITAIDFSQGLNATLSLLFSSDWISNTLSKVAQAMFGDSVNLEQIAELVATTLATIVVHLVLFILMIVLGIVVGIFVVKLLLRKEMTRVKIGKLILFSFLDALFWLLIILIINLAGTFVPWLSIVLVVLIIIFFTFICLLEGFIFYARKKVPFKKVVNIKNVLKLYVIELMIFAITAAVSVILVVIFKTFIGLYIALPLIEIGIIASGLEAENYVVNLVDENTTDPSNILYRGKL